MGGDGTTLKGYNIGVHESRSEHQDDAESWQDLKPVRRGLEYDVGEAIGRSGGLLFVGAGIDPDLVASEGSGLVERASEILVGHGEDGSVGTVDGKFSAVFERPDPVDTEFRGHHAGGVNDYCIIRNRGNHVGLIVVEHDVLSTLCDEVAQLVIVGAGSTAHEHKVLFEVRQVGQERLTGIVADVVVEARGVKRH